MPAVTIVEDEERRPILSNVIPNTLASFNDSLFNDPNFGYNNPQGLEVAISSQSREDFKDNFLPNEGIARDLVNADFEPLADEAGDRALQSSELTRGEFNRTLQRSGATLTAGNQAGIERAQGIDALLGATSAENLTRREYRDRNIDATGDLIGIGEGVQGAAVTGASQAGGQARAISDANRAQKAQDRANLISTGLGVAALAVMV